MQILMQMHIPGRSQWFFCGYNLRADQSLRFQHKGSSIPEEDLSCRRDGVQMPLMTMGRSLKPELPIENAKKGIRPARD